MLYFTVLTILAVCSYGDAESTPVNIGSPLLRQALPNCPTSCCKRYCVSSGKLECTPGATASAITCATSKAAANSCFNSFGAGCGATQCTPRTTCSISCGTVLDIVPIDTCN